MPRLRLLRQDIELSRSATGDLVIVVPADAAVVQALGQRLYRDPKGIILAAQARAAGGRPSARDWPPRGRRLAVERVEAAQ